MSFGIPHSCQMYWWATGSFFKSINHYLESSTQLTYLHAYSVEMVNQLTQSFSQLTPQQQTLFVENLKNLSFMADTLGNEWVSPANSDNNPNVEIRIQNYNNQERVFYNLVHQFIENPDFTEINVIVTRFLDGNVSLGIRYYNDFNNMFGV
jgi:hypothetical protein